GTTRPFPRCGARSGPQSQSIDPEMFGTKAPRTSRDCQHPTFQTVPAATPLSWISSEMCPFATLVIRIRRSSERRVCYLSAFRGKADLAKAMMAPVDAPRDKESPGHTVRGFQEVSQLSRDQGALDAPILSQSRTAQNCYLAGAAMRPDPPNTCSLSSASRTCRMKCEPWSKANGPSWRTSCRRRSRRAEIMPSLTDSQTRSSSVAYDGTYWVEFRTADGRPV